MVKDGWANQVVESPLSQSPSFLNSLEDMPKRAAMEAREMNLGQLKVRRQEG